MCEVEVCDRFARGEEAVYVVRAGEEFERNVPGGRALRGDEADDFRLAFVDGAEVAVEELFIVGDRLAVAAVDERRRERAKAREAHQVFGERAEAARGVNGVGREYRVRRDALQDAVARDDGS